MSPEHGRLSRRVIVGVLVAVVLVTSSTWGASPRDLLAAAAAGDAARVQELIRSGVDVNAREDEGPTALMAASLRGHEGVIRALIEARAEVNVATRDGDTALMTAAYRGHRSIVELLLKAGADVERRNRDGLTASAIAKQAGHAAIAEMLVVRSQQLDEKPLEVRPSLFPEVPNTIYSHSGFAGVPRPKVQGWEERVQLRQSGKLERSTTRHTVVEADQRVIRLTHLLSETDPAGKPKSEQWSVKALGGMMLVAWGRGTGQPKPVCRVERVDSVSGQLFPLKIGNRLSVTGAWNCGRVSSRKETWEVLERIDASHSYPTLSGHVWMVKSGGVVFHFIDALGIAVYRDGSEGGGIEMSQRLVEFTPVGPQAFNCRVCKLPQAGW